MQNIKYILTTNLFIASPMLYLLLMTQISIAQTDSVKRIQILNGIKEKWSVLPATNSMHKLLYQDTFRIRLTEFSNNFELIDSIDYSTCKRIANEINNPNTSYDQITLLGLQLLSRLSQNSINTFLDAINVERICDKYYDFNKIYCKNPFKALAFDKFNHIIISEFIFNSRYLEKSLDKEQLITIAQIIKELDKLGRKGYARVRLDSMERTIKMMNNFRIIYDIVAYDETPNKK